MWRVKTDTKFKNSFFPGLIYWNHNRIHLNTFKKSISVPMVPPLTKQDAAKGRGFPCFAKTTQMCKPENSIQYNATNYCLCTSEREVLNVVHK